MTTTAPRLAAGEWFGALSDRPRPNLRRVGLGLAVVVGAMVLVGLLIAGAGDRVAVVAVRRPVAVGEPLQAADLVTARIAADAALRPARAERLDDYVGRVTAVPLVPGTLLTEAALSTGPRVRPGESIVAVPLRLADLPAGLGPEDPVRLVGPEEAGLAARVYAIADRTSTVVVSVIVPRHSAEGVARAAQAGLLALVLDGPA